MRPYSDAILRYSWSNAKQNVAVRYARCGRPPEVAKVTPDLEEWLGPPSHGLINRKIRGEEATTNAKEVDDLVDGGDDDLWIQYVHIVDKPVTCFVKTATGLQRTGFVGQSC